MVESAIAATAAAQISPLVDWADIDGPFLTEDDPVHRRPVRARQARAPESTRVSACASGAPREAPLRVLAPGHFAHDAKTAHGVIAYGSDETVAVIDPTNAGKRVRDVAALSRSDAPIVASVAEALQYAPTALLIGTAPRGGALPAAWRAEILAAIAAKLEIVSGLHDQLGDGSQNSNLLRSAPATTIWDVREPPDVPLFSGAVYKRRGADPACWSATIAAVGKMTVALELCRAARTRRQARRVRSDRTDRHHDRRLGHLGRSRHRRLCTGRRRDARALCRAIESGPDRGRRTRRDQPSRLRARLRSR